MFIYYFVVAPGPFDEVEESLLEVLDGLPGHADVAYRKGEELRSRLRPRQGGVAKTVRLHLGQPHREDGQVRIPLTWEATGTPGLFPRMDADLVWPRWDLSSPMWSSGEPTAPLSVQWGGRSTGRSSTASPRRA